MRAGSSHATAPTIRCSARPADPTRAPTSCRFLERSWPAVKAVTKQLYFKGPASHQDVCLALGLSDHGGPGSLGLALIRSGLRAAV